MVITAFRMQRIFILCCVLLLFSSCTSLTGTTGKITIPTPTEKIPIATRTQPAPTHTPLSDRDIAIRIVKNMTLNQKLGQMVIAEFYGPILNDDLKQMLQTDQVSGVLIENKNDNARNHTQLVTLNKDMQRQAHIPLFITTDYEGGVVNELRRITGERASNASIGASNDPQKAYDAGYGAATDLTRLGLNVNFMPIVDVLTNVNNPSLPQRTFGSDATLVTAMGRAYLKGLSDGNVIGCLKHFPGLGSANLDPHLSLPTVNRSLATLNAVDLVPYRTMINEGIVPMVMVTHILNPQLDPNLPTSLSPNVVTNLLRNDLNFRGVIISDTLWMGGVSSTYDLAHAATLAVKAGTDLLLGPRGPTETREMLNGLSKAVTSGEITDEQINASVVRIIELKLKYKILSHSQASQIVGVSFTTPCSSCTSLAVLTGCNE